MANEPVGFRALHSCRIPASRHPSRAGRRAGDRPASVRRWGCGSPPDACRPTMRRWDRATLTPRDRRPRVGGTLTKGQRRRQPVGGEAGRRAGGARTRRLPGGPVGEGAAAELQTPRAGSRLAAQEQRADHVRTTTASQRDDRPQRGWHRAGPRAASAAVGKKEGGSGGGARLTTGAGPASCREAESERDEIGEGRPSVCPRAWLPRGRKVSQDGSFEQPPPRWPGAQKAGVEVPRALRRWVGKPKAGHPRRRKARLVQVARAGRSSRPTPELRTGGKRTVAGGLANEGGGARPPPPRRPPLQQAEGDPRPGPRLKPPVPRP